MKTKNVIISILIFSFLALPLNSALAEIVKGIQGEISIINLDALTFQVTRGDLAIGKENAVNIIVLEDTRFNGLNSLEDLRIGDEVSVEMQLNEKTNLWEARSIALVKVKIRDTAL